MSHKYGYMSGRFIQGKKDQKLLFCEDYIDDRLKNDHEVYLFDRIMDELDISSIENRYSKEGGSAYHPHTMLKVIFYGYYRGIRSSRKISLACEELLPFIYLAGDLKIKFRALADFRVRFRHELQDIFREIIQLGFRLGMVTGKKGYQDGSKFRADASNEKFKTKGEWEKEKVELIQEIEDYFESSSNTDVSEDRNFGRDNRGYSSTGDEASQQKLFSKLDVLLAERKIEKMSDKKPGATSAKPISEAVVEVDGNENKEDATESAEVDGYENKEDAPESTEATEISEAELIEKAARALKIHDMLVKNSAENSETKLNLTDPECRFMKCRGRIDSNYNAQIITENGFINAADVSNDETDYNQLEPIIEQVAENLPDTTLEQAGFDAGYFSGRNLKYLVEQGIEGFIPEHNDYYLENLKADEDALCKEGFRIYNFSYDSKSDQWICPTGNGLDFARKELREGTTYEIYKSKPVLCMLCPHHKSCLSTKSDKRLGYRSIRTDEYTVYRNDMILKMQTEEAQEFFSRRKVEPEPVFGNMKKNKNFITFLVRGLDKVRGEFNIMCSAHNIGKIITFIRGSPAIV